MQICWLVFDSKWTVIYSYDFIAMHAEHYWTCYAAWLVSLMSSCLFALFKNRCATLCQARWDEPRMDPLIDKMTGRRQTWSIEYGSIDVSFVNKDDIDDTQKEQSYQNAT